VNKRTEKSEPITFEGRECGPAPVLNRGFRPFLSCRWRLWPDFSCHMGGRQRWVREISRRFGAIFLARS
jgi:hypothetical protein